ncbi:hypothetical protein GCM10027361_00210 [Erwinia aphidicola]
MQDDNQIMVMRIVPYQQEAAEWATTQVKGGLYSRGQIARRVKLLKYDTFITRHPTELVAAITQHVTKQNIFFD